MKLETCARAIFSSVVKLKSGGITDRAPKEPYVMKTGV